MLRVSTNMIYQQSMQQMHHGQSEMMRYSDQLSTGYRVVKPSDDAMAASLSVMVSQGEVENVQYKVARAFAGAAMSLEDSVLNSVTTTIQNIKTNVIYGGDGALNDNDRVILAGELQGLKDQLFALANTMDSLGRYVFAGYLNNKAPFVMDPATKVVTYAGGTLPVTQQVEYVYTNRQMIINHTGDTVFGPNGANVFDSIDTALKALNTPIEGATQSVRDGVMAQLDQAHRGYINALTKIAAVRAQLGNQLKELDDLNALGAARTLNNVGQISELIDTDFYDATSNLHKQKTALQASMDVFKVMQSMSLFARNH